MVWTDYKVTTPENQNQFILPMNSDTQTIYYNMRFLISSNQINPIAWEVSKVEDTFPPGVIYITIKQDQFNPVTDNKELMIADYYKSPLNPIEENIIEYSGDAVVKVGGSYKLFSYDSKEVYTWDIKGIPEDKYDAIVNSEQNQIKIKVEEDYNLIDSTFSLSLLRDDGVIVSSIEVGVISL